MSQLVAKVNDGSAHASLFKDPATVTIDTDYPLVAKLRNDALSGGDGFVQVYELEAPYALVLRLKNADINTWDAQGLTQKQAFQVGECLSCLHVGQMCGQIKLLLCIKHGDASLSTVFCRPTC